MLSCFFFLNLLVKAVQPKLCRFTHDRIFTPNLFFFNLLMAKKRRQGQTFFHSCDPALVCALLHIVLIHLCFTPKYIYSAGNSTKQLQSSIFSHFLYRHISLVRHTNQNLTVQKECCLQMEAEVFRSGTKGHISVDCKVI